MELYITAYYWTITTLTTSGYGDITPSGQAQMLFVIPIQLLGAAMYGLIIGSIAGLIANIDVAKRRYREKMEQINAFLRYRSIPDNLKAKINSYYAYLWETRKGYEEAEFIHDLPAALKESVALHLNKEIIERVPLFENANENLIRDIILALEFCDLYQLNKDQFDHVIEHYPEFKHSIQVLAEERRDKVEALRKQETSAHADQ